MVKKTDREWKLTELLEAAGVTPFVDHFAGSHQTVISELSTDSRTTRERSCFVALRGGREDGHGYVDDAVKRGASAVVTSSDAAPAELPPGIASIRVRDVRSALGRLAAAFHGFASGQPYAGMTLIGVTGTNGKSTTCRMIQSVLQAAGRPTALLGTVEYDLVSEKVDAPWTTPPPVELYRHLRQAAEAGARHAVMEVSSHSLAQSRCAAVRFAVGVFTNLSGDHLDYHGTEESYGLAKKKLFDGLDDEATAVINADDRWAARMVSGFGGREVIRFGLQPGVEVSARLDALSLDGCRFGMNVRGAWEAIRLPLAGRHNVYNAMATCAACAALGIELPTIRRGLESLEQVRGRLQRVDAGSTGFAVLVDYAHTDDALVNVLSALRPLTKGRLVCVFGCGGDRDRSKRPRMARAAATHADQIFVTSDNPREEPADLIIDDIVAGFAAADLERVAVDPNRRTAIRAAIEAARPGDVVLIAGKGHEDYQIVGRERHHFDDVAEAEIAIRQLGAVGA